ncbi:MAG: DNA recombination protein RmuC [Clostridia bacterium]|jgi:DNA recombination protein RmuC|nr:DNA recombination protein RmuC [Clostridia bacterium]MDH7573998.1 DNA recombination protein RmuC [Clostridia bacterium]
MATGTVAGVALIGLAVGFLVAWALLGSRARAAEGLAAELRQALTRTEEELGRQRADLETERAARVRAETLLAEAGKDIEEQKRLLDEATQKLTHTFGALAAEALRNNNQAFLELARKTLEVFLTEAQGDLGRRQQAIEALVTPLREALERYDRQIQELEKTRAEAYGSLTRHLQELSRAQQQLQSETGRLVSALRSPRARGRWGEITLQRVVEMAGMSPYCDFVTQPTAETEDGRRRPDLVVNLPNGRAIVVDAKAPLEAYLDAVETEDEDARRAALTRHAQAVRSHMIALGSKEYQNQFRPGADLVVLFLPGEPFFAAAVESDPHLIEDGINRRVLLATPITLVALLKAVAYGWQERQATENAEKVIEAGRQLFERLITFADHLEGLRKGLSAAVRSYNEAVGSWQSRLLPGARRLKELGAARAQREPKPVEEVEPVFREVQQASAD